MPDVSSMIDLYDSEIPILQDVVDALNQKTGKHVNMEGFRKEIIGRFEESGFIVKVKVYSTADQGYLPLDDVYAFDIEIIGRCEPRPFDYDRMRYEVVHDVAGLEPDKKGLKIPVPYSPDDLRDNPSKSLHTCTGECKH